MSCRGQPRRPTTATRSSPAWWRITSTSTRGAGPTSRAAPKRRSGWRPYAPPAAGDAAPESTCRGAGVAWTAGQALAAAAQDFLPQNERGEMTEKILAYVRRKHPLKPRDIQQFLKGRLRSKEIKDILSQLVEAGEVEWQGDEYQPTAK